MTSEKTYGPLLYDGGDYKVYQTRSLEGRGFVDIGINLGAWGQFGSSVTYDPNTGSWTNNGTSLGVEFGPVSGSASSQGDITGEISANYSIVQGGFFIDQDGKFTNFVALGYFNPKIGGARIGSTLVEGARGVPSYGNTIEYANGTKVTTEYVRSFQSASGWAQKVSFYDAFGELVDIVQTDLPTDVAIEMASELMQKCFSSNAEVLTPDGTTTEISSIRPGDLVLSFDPLADNGRGALVPKKVVRTFTNITEEWLRLTWVEEDEKQELVTTPGHEFLTAHGGFRQIEKLMAGGTGTLVLADGSEAEVSAERIVYGAETAEMFEQAEGYVLPQNGNLALKPEFRKGWRTYNFEVEDFHTYVAGGTVRQSGLPAGSTLH